MVPQAALIADQEGVYVFVVEDGKAVVKRVKPGGESGTGRRRRAGLDRRRAGHRRGIAGRAPRRAGAGEPAADAQQELIRCSPPFSSTGRGSRSSSPSSPRSPGSLALYSIPIAQYPDIVPPQVSVTTFYPGANSRGGRRDRRAADRGAGRRRRQDDLHEERQRRRRQLHAHRLVRARHRSRHQHRQRQQPGADRAVRACRRTCSARASRSRRSRRPCSASIAVYSPKHTHDPLFLSNYVTINLLDQIKSTPGVGDASLWGPQDYAMRAWVRTDRLTGLNLTTGDIINAIKSQNVQAAVGRIGARPISNDQQLQLNIQTKGRLTSPRSSRTSSCAPIRTGRCCAWATSRGSSSAPPISTARPASTAGRQRRSRSTRSPGANAIATLEGGAQDRITELQKRFPDDLDLEGHLRSRPPSSPTPSTRCRRR